ncbi:hypothetical protein NCCP2495_03240 [Dietzia sp. NCCP-2495]|nr:hypothetical protein NCCP2495_03240 [Dietzia sp. NCCP-2495]
MGDGQNRTRTFEAVMPTILVTSPARTPAEHRPRIDRVSVGAANGVDPRAQLHEGGGP